MKTDLPFKFFRLSSSGVRVYGRNTNGHARSSFVWGRYNKARETTIIESKFCRAKPKSPESAPPIPAKRVAVFSTPRPRSSIDSGINGSRCEVPPPTRIGNLGRTLAWQARRQRPQINEGDTSREFCENSMDAIRPPGMVIPGRDRCTSVRRADLKLLTQKSKLNGFPMFVPRHIGGR